MRFSIFGVWIAFLSIVKCQTNPDSGCYDQLTQVTVEVSPLIQSSICADNTPATIVIDSQHGFWFGNLEGFCTSSVLNIGIVEMNYLVSSPSLAIQLLKTSETLDAAKVDVSVSEERPGTHLITVWGHRNTRFVLKVVRQCRSARTLNAGLTTPDSLTTLPEVTGNALPPTTPQTPRPTTLGLDQNNNLETTTEGHDSNTDVSDDDCATFTINADGTFECHGKINIQNENATTTESGLEISKIEWMERKRVEFEKKMENMRNHSAGEQETNSGSDDVLEMVTPTITTVGTRSDHRNIFDVDFSTHVPSFVTSVVSQSSITFNVVDSAAPIIGDSIQPRLEVHSSIHPTLMVDVVATLYSNVPENMGIFPSVPELVPTVSPSTGPGAFFPFSYVTIQSSNLVDSNRAMLSSTPSLLQPGEFPSPTKVIFPKSLSTTDTSTQIKHSVTDNPVQPHNTPVHPSESSVFSSSILDPPDTTHILSSSSSRIETPVLSSSVNPSDYSTTIRPSPTPSPTPSPNPFRVPKTGKPSSSVDLNKVVMTTDNAMEIPSSTEDDSRTHSTTENSTVPQKKAEEDSLKGETFWPVVAALVVGIPSVVVFGIAIVVIHRRRTPMTRKIFAMRSFSNVSTPSSSLPGYTAFKSKRDSSSQSSV